MCVYVVWVCMCMYMCVDVYAMSVCGVYGMHMCMYACVCVVCMMCVLMCVHYV